MIHTVTLNPAVDKLLFLKEFKKNITNRLLSSEDALGGKGTHVSINLQLLDTENKAFGIVHGNTGSEIIQVLETYGTNVNFIHKTDSDADSRTNYLIIEENGDCSTLASRGVSLGEQDIEELITLLLEHVGEGDFLILSGDATNCYDPYVYNTIMKRLKECKPKFFLDASGPTLYNCIQESPYLIKPNLDELSELYGSELTNDTEIIEAIESLSNYNIEIIAVSLGSDGSIIKTPEGIYRITPPSVNVKNTIGCGDCFLSGIIFGLTQNYSTTETLKFATAISAATAESNSSIGFDRTRANELISQVYIKKIK
ncbi:MAG: 1-phosphofructokinase [Herbinix sp.]|jgi:1-phosphofructokinase family hexose kinase|nr:1-phosphofructokinase [Herbinix sp.]